MSLISCENASFAYEGHTAVKDLNFTVKTGDYLCIVGENGSGKTTLMNGLLKLKNPSDGKVIFGEGLLPNEIGYLPQQTSIQKDFPASPYEIVLSGRLSTLGFRPFYSKADKVIAEENMELLDISSLKNKCYRELSGGQQQRVLLARALCATQKLLLLDEPVAGLDPKVTQELYRLVKKINEDSSITIIMVSHDIQSATKYASHILHLKNKPLFFGTTEDYLKTDIGINFVGGEEND